MARRSSKNASNSSLASLRSMLIYIARFTWSSRMQPSHVSCMMEYSRSTLGPAVNQGGLETLHAMPWHKHRKRVRTLHDLSRIVIVSMYRNNYVSPQ